MLFHAACRVVHSCQSNAFAREGLEDLSNPQILFLLQRQAPNKRITLREIADSIGISPATATVSVKRMEKAGLVDKFSDEQDLRRSYVVLTERGKRLTNRCHDISDTIHSQMLNGFSQEEIRQFSDFYTRMLTNLSETGVRLPEFLRKKNNT